MVVDTSAPCAYAKEKIVNENNDAVTIAKVFFI